MIWSRVLVVGVAQTWIIAGPAWIVSESSTCRDMLSWAAATSASAASPSATMAAEESSRVDKSSAFFSPKLNGCKVAEGVAGKRELDLVHVQADHRARLPHDRRDVEGDLPTPASDVEAAHTRPDTSAIEKCESGRPVHLRQNPEPVVALLAPTDHIARHATDPSLRTRASDRVPITARRLLIS